MKNSGWDVVCVDSSNEARSIAMQRFNLKVLNIDQFFDLRNIRFDVITMWHTLEHVDKPIAVSYTHLTLPTSDLV